jgi:integrase
MFRVSGERIRYLTPAEEKRLFEQLENCEWLNPIAVALNTGMRRGEICNLHGSSINRWWQESQSATWETQQPQDCAQWHAKQAKKMISALGQSKREKQRLVKYQIN